jgi:hypothetical protein
MTEARIFIVALPDLQKIGKNKTVGRQYVWGQVQTNCIIKAVKDKKNYQNDEKDGGHRSCCYRIHPAGKPSTQLTPKRLWLLPVNFQAENIRIVVSG